MAAFGARRGHQIRPESARGAASESKNGVGRRGGPEVGLEALAAHDIDRAVEQLRDVVLERDIFIDADPGGRIDLDQISMSLSGWASPRAREPNNAA
jgi:hypothetical protein